MKTPKQSYVVVNYHSIITKGKPSIVDDKVPNTNIFRVTCNRMVIQTNCSYLSMREFSLDLTTMECKKECNGWMRWKHTYILRCYKSPSCFNEIPQQPNGKDIPNPEAQQGRYSYIEQCR